MGIFELFPFTNFQEKNLDWFIRQLKKLEQKVNDYTKGFTFADPLAWDINKSYEPLTFVEYNDDIFGSSQAVPAGVQITNNDYWVRFTSYSNLISLINALDARVDDLEAELPPNPKRMIVVSDSYGLGRNGADSWVTHFASYMTDYANVYNWSNGSMGIVKLGDGGYKALTYMQSRASEITYPNSIEAVVIAMGANDINNHANFASEFQSLISYIKNTYPNATVYLGMIGNIRVKNVSTLNNYLQTINLYQTVARNYTKCKYLSGVENIMHNNNYIQADGVHPTTTGATAIAQGVAEAFRNGYYIYRAIQLVQGDTDVRMEINGDIATIDFIPNKTTETVFPNRHYVDYLTIADPLVYVSEAHPVQGFWSSFDSTVAPFMMGMKYAGGKIQLSSLQTSSRTLAANMAGYGCTISIPTILA